jgi:hypothetical protein
MRVCCIHCLSFVFYVLYFALGIFGCKIGCVEKRLCFYSDFTVVLYGGVKLQGPGQGTGEEEMDGIMAGAGRGINEEQGRK